MKILVLSLLNKFKKNDKTEYTKFDALKSGDNSVEVKQIRLLFIRRELNRARKTADLVVISGINSEKAFRSAFAFTIKNGERKIQKTPSAKKKGRRKKGEEIETITYNRKITHIFPVDIGSKKAYAFNYAGVRVVTVPYSADAQALEALPAAVDRVFSENAETYPDGYSLKEKQVRVLTFFERHFPIRSDPASEKARKTVMLAALCVFLVAGYLFVKNAFIIPMRNSAIISEIQTVFYEGSEQSGSQESQKIPEKNWKKLKKINKEIVGWVKINNTKINYPILWHKGDNADSQYYLWRNYKGEYYEGGTTSIFMDWRSKKGMNSKNVILHGHHMEDGSMFADLLKYGGTSGNLTFYKKSPVVYISTEKGGTVPYKIFSVFKSNTDPKLGEYFDFYCGSFKNDSQFLNYVYNLRIRSLINCPVSVNEDDQILSLVTCSYEFGDGNNFRTVVVARKLRKGESADVDTGAATLNKNAVWPQCYYNSYGGTRPTVSTFRNEYKKGNITWYDGTYSGKGSEQLPTSYTPPTQPTTKPTKPTTATKATEPKNQKFKVEIFGKGGKRLVSKKVKKNASVKLPTIKPYTKNGYKFTLSYWKAKVTGKNQKIKKNVTKVIITTDTKIYAKFKKTKIKTTPKPTAATKPTKPATKPTSKPTEATTAPTEPKDAPEATEPEE